jgi:hypothetical protein
VSLLWRKRRHLRIGLGAKRVMVSGSEAVELPLADDWRTAAEALPAILKAYPAREASVVLADQFARYALLPWSEAVKSPEQWLVLAQHRFSALHGAVASGWDVKVTETASRGPRVACAVDRDLLERLLSTCLEAGVKLVSVQPFLIAAFNRMRSEVGNGSCWIVVEEPGRLTLALIQRGAWIAIRARRSDEHWRAVLPEILERESAFLGLDEPCSRVIVCAQGEFDPRMHDAWRAHAMSYRDLALALDR